MVPQDAGPVLGVVVTHGTGVMPPCCDARTDDEPKDAGYGAAEVYVGVVMHHVSCVGASDDLLKWRLVSVRKRRGGPPRFIGWMNH